MAKLTNLSKNTDLLASLKIASSHQQRTKGLIGCTHLSEQEGLWIKKCNWIHTFFMSIPIDVIYLGRDMKVRKLQKNLRPWRLPAPVITASSVIEIAAGNLNNWNIELGDQLNVGD